MTIRPCAPGTRSCAPRQIRRPLITETEYRMSTPLTIHSIRSGESRVVGPSIEERMSRGKGLRYRVSRSSHAEWTAPTGRPDPIEVLQHSDRGRLPELLPIRYGRMRQSPFAFFRGSAALMAWDLSKTPATGIRVQACGDCHAWNFGGFASPERRLLFDINDF